MMRTSSSSSLSAGDHSTVTSGSRVLCGRLKDDEMDIGEELVKEGYAVNVVEKHDDASCRSSHYRGKHCGGCRDRRRA